MAMIEVKERPLVIVPCPRCIGGQIFLYYGKGSCLQCGYDEEANRSEEIPDDSLVASVRETERVVCPKCGKEVCLNSQMEEKVIRPHKDPVTEGQFQRPWCDMSGEVISQ